MTIDKTLLQQIVEGALMAAGKPLSVKQLQALFEEGQCPDKEELIAVLEDIEADCRGRGYQLKKVASGYRFQVIAEVADWVSRLWEEKPQRYSRALLETLALIAYRQPITRGDIESIRGVAVSSHIIKTLQEREWVKVVGHKDVPGRPALYATTRQFLDYFNLNKLDELPTLAEIKDLDSMNAELELSLAEAGVAAEESEQTDTDSDTDPVAAEGDVLDVADGADTADENAATADDTVASSEEVDAAPGTAESSDPLAASADSNAEAVDAEGDDTRRETSSEATV